MEDTPIPFSLWDYLREELLATDFDSHQEMKWERVSNFLNVPLAVEKVWLSIDNPGIRRTYYGSMSYALLFQNKPTPYARVRTQNS